MNKLNKLITSMLIENTGKALCDSGGIYGRNWERNQDKHFINDPYYTFEVYENDDGLEIIPTVSTYHWMVDHLELDSNCDKFNKTPCNDWDGENFGTSSDQQELLDKWNNEGRISSVYWTNQLFGQFNTYNQEYANLDQGLQGSLFELDGQAYVLLQVHGGCDIRGGYTDAKMFRCAPDLFLYAECGGPEFTYRGQQCECTGEDYRYHLEDDRDTLPQGTKRGVQRILNKL